MIEGGRAGPLRSTDLSRASHRCVVAGLIYLVKIWNVRIFGQVATSSESQYSKKLLTGGFLVLEILCSTLLSIVLSGWLLFHVQQGQSDATFF